MTSRKVMWLLAAPLMLAGSQVGHVLAYRWAYPEAPVRVQAFLETGHGYLDYAPIVLGFAGAGLLLSLLLAMADAARGRAPRALPAWAFALLPALGFTFQEHLERWLSSGVFPASTALDPTFLPGLLLQLPFGLCAYLAARLLLRTAARLAGALSPTPPPRVRPAASISRRPPESEPPRRSVLARCQPERGPPVPAPA